MFTGYDRKKKRHRRIALGGHLPCGCLDHEPGQGLQSPRAHDKPWSFLIQEQYPLLNPISFSSPHLPRMPDTHLALSAFRKSLMNECVNAQILLNAFFKNGGENNYFL